MMVAKGSLKAYTRQPAFSDSANTQADTDSRGYNKNKLGAANWWTHHQDQYLDRDVTGLKMQRFSVAKLGNDGKDSGAENLYASRPDPNSVSEGSRLGC